MENYSPLDLLKEAAHYVENHQANVNSVSGLNHSAKESSPQRSPRESAVCENGDSQHHRDTMQRNSLVSTESSVPKYASHKEMNSKTSPRQDEQANSRKHETMRMYNVNEVTTSDETAMSHHNNHHHSNGILARVYADDKPLTYQSVASPAKLSPQRKRTSSSHSATDSDHKPRAAVLSQQLGAPFTGSVTQPVTQVPAANPMMPFISPLMYQAAFDPALCADVLARQGLTNVNSDTRKQAPSPDSTPNPTSSSGSIQAQGLQRLMYPLHNPALFMGARAAAPPGIGLGDISMGFPSQLAALNQTATMLPQQLAAYSELSDAHKRAMENSTQALPAHLLTHPYLKAFSLDPATAKDRNVSTPTLPTGIGLPAGISPYAADFLQKYHEVLSNETMKSENLATKSQSPKVQCRSVSPESIKKSNHANPAHFHAPYSHSSTISRSKSPISERKISTPTTRPLKNGNERFEARAFNCQPRDKDNFHRDNHDPRLNGEDAGRRLMAMAQSPQNAPTDVYGVRYKNPHDRRSPSPYGNDRWEEYRRSSREYSPHLSASVDKPVKKRSFEQFGIPQDLIPDSKTHSPGSHSSVPGMRLSKSPPRGRSSSPSDRLSQPPSATNPFSALAGKSGLPLNEKEAAAAYFASSHPYLLHPALGNLSALPFSALSASYLRQAEATSSAANNAIAEAIAASSLAGASPLFRSQVSPEAMEYARLAGISSYIPLLTPQHQQAFLAGGMVPTTSTTQDYAAALKQAAALQQSLLLETREKERLSSPSHPPMTTMRPFLQNPVSYPSTLVRGSPNPSHQKTIPKHSSTYHLPPSTHPYNSHPRLTPGHPEGENRVLKRDLSPSPGKRTLTAAPSPVHSLPKSSNSQIRRLEEEKGNRLKRRSADEDVERLTSKDGALKRKREVTADPNAADVDEHFRRSLGKDYKKPETNHNKVVVAGEVDDHFKKSLGSDTWSQVQSNHKPSSPEPNDPPGNERENKVRSSAPTSSYPNQYPYSSGPPAWQYPTALRARQFTSLSYNPKAPRNSAGNRTMKARGTVYPELAADTALTISSNSLVARSSTGRNEAKKDLMESKPDSSALSLESNHRSEPGFEPSAASTKQNLTAKSESKNTNLAPPPSSPPESSKSHGLNLTNSFHVNPILTTQPPPYGTPPSTTGSYVKSPSRPPPAYSPRSASTTSSSNHPSVSPRHTSPDGRSNDDSGTTAAIPLQS